MPLRRALDEAAEDSAVELVPSAPDEEVKEDQEEDRREEHDHPQQTGRRRRRLRIDAQPLARLLFLGRPALVALDERLKNRVGRRLRGRNGHEPFDLLGLLVGRALIVLFLPQLATNLGALRQDRLDIVVLDLLVEPRIVADRRLRLGDELIEDQAEPAKKKQPQPRRSRRPTRAVGLAYVVRRGPARGFLLRRSILHAFLLFSQPIVHAPVRNATRYGAPPHDPGSRIVPWIAQKFRGSRPRHTDTS